MSIDLANVTQHNRQVTFYNSYNMIVAICMKIRVLHPLAPIPVKKSNNMYLHGIISITCYSNYYVLYFIFYIFKSIESEFYLNCIKIIRGIMKKIAYSSLSLSILFCFLTTQASVVTLNKQNLGESNGYQLTQDSGQYAFKISPSEMNCKFIENISLGCTSTKVYLDMFNQMPDPSDNSKENIVFFGYNNNHTKEGKEGIWIDDFTCSNEEPDYLTIDFNSCAGLSNPYKSVTSRSCLCYNTIVKDDKDDLGNKAVLTIDGACQYSQK